MLTESAVVIEYESGRAKVKCQARSACGTCSAKSACGTSALSELAGTGARGEHIFTVETITPLKVGQWVEIGLSEHSLIKSALLAYCVPLFTLLFSTWLFYGMFEHELISVIFICLATALSFFAVRWYAKKLDHKSTYQPVLLRVL